MSVVAFLDYGELAVSGAEDDAVCVCDTRSGVERLQRDLGVEAPHDTFWSATDGGTGAPVLGGNARRDRRG